MQEQQQTSRLLELQVQLAYEAAELEIRSNAYSRVTFGEAGEWLDIDPSVFVERAKEYLSLLGFLETHPIYSTWVRIRLRPRLISRTTLAAPTAVR